MRISKFNYLEIIAIEWIRKGWVCEDSLRERAQTTLWSYNCIDQREKQTVMTIVEKKDERKERNGTDTWVTGVWGKEEDFVANLAQIPGCP